MNALKMLAVVGLMGSALGLTTSALAGGLNPGADVIHSGLGGGIWSPTGLPVGDVYAYALGSNTCNIGDTPLIWLSNNTPALSMNAFRLHNGRLEQIGVGMAKTACCVANSPVCGSTSCSGPSGHLLPGCQDTYSGSWNGIISRLAPRSRINPYTGAFQSIPAFGGNTTIGRRLQVKQGDMNPANYPGALFFVEGHYICTEDANNGNWANNASYGRVTVSPTYTFASAGFVPQRPGIYAWLDHGNGAGVPDPNVIIQNVDVPGEGRFMVASKITQTSPGNWHYEYAVHNFNSDRAASSFRVPLPAGALVTNAGFHDVWYHDEDAIYDGTDWVQPVSAFEVRWSSPQTYAENVNANAIRWGTMYNFWFDCDRAPVAGKAEIDLFKSPVGCQAAKVAFNVSVPGAPCDGDISRNGAVDANDLLGVITTWGPCACPANCPANIDGIAGNAVDVNDLLKVISTWGGCQ